MAESTIDNPKDRNKPFPPDVPEELPLLPTRDVVIFSNMILPLFVGREASILAVEEAMRHDRVIMLAAQRDQAIDDPEPDDIYEMGTVAMIMRVLKLPDGRLKVLIQGLARAGVLEWTQREPWARVRIQQKPEPPEGPPTPEVEALLRNVREQSEKILSIKGLISNDVVSILGDIDSPGRLADLVASNLRLKTSDAQAVFEILDPAARLARVNELLSKELEVSTMQAKIQSEAQEEMNRSQREYFLREQMRAIMRELGDTDEKAEEAAEYTEKIKKARMPKTVEAEAMKQLGRLEQMHRDSAEASLIRTYLDWMVESPWSRSTRDKLDIKEAKRTLDEDHYGLTKVKDRILEYLSVRKLNRKMKGPILCFAGPPGVGKTSLGQSIARAMGRKFTRISLGGIRDEAEIRGHRRTYIGALPGRIIQGLKTAGTNNPVFMLDEIDKIGSDFRGDPSSALLEALDPEQNNAFSDHYLNVPFDLSKVMFITTANMTDPIPDALLDRMEVIRLSGYTEDEKLEIARRHLMPRQLGENGLHPDNLSISSGALSLAINQYTEEAGLRNLERTIGTICRKCARRLAEGEPGPFSVTAQNLHKLLGPPQFLPDPEQEQGECGVATGLAWTQYGGELLYLETSAVPGKGGLTLTGQLGEVMRESAQAALSLARAHAGRLDIDPEFYEKMDLHIHAPAGAIPKDGPSAGVTMLCSLISALASRPVPRNIAMTGEITLSGKILPIGGLKEKALAALRAEAVDTVLIPFMNTKDLTELPPKIKKKLKFIPLKNVSELFALVFPPQEKPAKKKPAAPKAPAKKPAGKAREAGK